VNECNGDKPPFSFFDTDTKRFHTGLE